MAKPTSSTSVVQHHLLQGMVALSLIGNLLAANNILSFWNEAEVMNLLSVQSASSGWFLPGLILQGVYAFAGLDAFALRLPGALLFMGTLAAFYFLGRKLFGEESLLTFLVTTSSALILVNLSKFAFADVYLLSAQLLNMIFLLRMLKTPGRQWEIGFWSSLLLGLLIHPLSMLIWGMAWWGCLYWWHPKGKSLKGSMLWLPTLALTFAIVFFGWVDWQSPAFFFAFEASEIGSSLVLLLLGCLPWLGFLPSGIRDLWMKRKKGEELSLFIVAWLLIGLLSYSSVVVTGLLFLMAKQVQLCLDPKYPFRKTLQVSISLVLVLSFAGVFLLLMGSFNLFDAPGFRAAVLAGGCYWALYFLGSIGVLMKKERVMIGGFVFSGLLLTAFFWARFGPLLETRRDLPTRLIEKALENKEEQSTPSTLWLSDRELLSAPKFRLYANEHFTNLQPLPTGNGVALPEQGIAIIDSVRVATIDTTTYAPQATVKGYSEVLGTSDQYWIIKK